MKSYFAGAVTRRPQDNNKLNLSYFISKRIRAGTEAGFSSTIHRIGVASIAVGLAAVTASFLIMRGFQNTIKDKIYSFSSHILVTKYTLNNSMAEQPFNFNLDLYNHYDEYGFIDHVQEYAHKPGLIKTDREVLGVILKGVGKSFDQNRFRENLIQGRFINFPDSSYSHEVVLSSVIAKKLNVKVGDDIILHFFQNPPRFRRLTVTGLYETNLSDYFDSKVIIGDIKLIQRLNDWGDSIAGGLQIYVKDVNKIKEDAAALEESIDYDLYGEQVSDTYIQVFEWLGLVSRQVLILLGIILTVVCVNMISVLLILVMERTQMIGLLKSLGAADGLIRRIFIYNGMSLIIKGLLFGNILGLGLCFLQYKLHLVKLNAHDYYMSYVPIMWDWLVVALLNILVFVVVTFVLLLPTAVISRIKPVQALRFD